MKIMILIAAMIVLPLTTFATGAKTTTQTKGAAAEAELVLIDAAELEKMMNEQKASTFVFDANNEKTRKNDGVIPGAKLLASASQYDAKLLPADKNATLVFYCANQKCMASHDAAKVAKKNGYQNAIVMADGIQGWKKAGKPVAKFTKN